MKAPHTSLLSLLIMLGSTPLFATPITAPEVDPGFQATISGTVHAIANAPDGRIVVGGEFSHVNGIPSSSIARLNSDGAIDNDFSVAVDGPVLCLRSGADGSIYAGGAFNSPTRHLLRLSPEGEFDLAIAAGGSTASRITCLAADMQNAVYVGGPFVHVGNSPGYYVAKFDPAGAIDATFSSALSRNFSMEAGANAVAVQSDGKVILAGNFGIGSDVAALVRLHADGSIDPNFSGNHGPMLYPKCVVLLEDGKILVAGTLNSSGQGFVRRLNPDGSVDDSFESETFSGGVECIALDAAGKILAGGNFDGKLARLNVNGSADPSWNIKADGAVRTILLQADGAILIGGAFTQIGGHPQSGIARLRNSRSFQALATNENGQFRARLQVKEGQAYTIEYSEDLRTWIAAGTAVASELGIEVSDEAATRKQRFFRARLLN